MLGTTGHFRPGHTGLVGLPIIFTVMFCFALVLIRPEAGQDSSVKTTNVNKSEPSIKNDVSKDRSKLSPAQPSKTDTGTSKPDAPASSLSSLAPAEDGGTPAHTDTPQPGAGAGQGVQSAVPDNQGDNVVYKVTQPVHKTLTNLLPE